MKIDLIDLTVRDLVNGYADDGEGGVVGYGGKLRPWLRCRRGRAAGIR